MAAPTNSSAAWTSSALHCFRSTTSWSPEIPSRSSTESVALNQGKCPSQPPRPPCSSQKLKFRSAAKARSARRFFRRPAPKAQWPQTPRGKNNERHLCQLFSSPCRAQRHIPLRAHGFTRAFDQRATIRRNSRFLRRRGKSNRLRPHPESHARRTHALQVRSENG